MSTALSGVRLARSRPSHPLELAAETLARPALPTDRLDTGRDLSDDRRWAVVDIARGGDRRCDARLDRSHDLDDALALGNQRVHHVAGTNLCRGFRRVAVHADVAAVAKLGRHRPGLDEA